MTGVRRLLTQILWRANMARLTRNFRGICAICCSALVILILIFTQAVVHMDHETIVTDFQVVPSNLHLDPELISDDKEVKQVQGQLKYGAGAVVADKVVHAATVADDVILAESQQKCTRRTSVGFVKTHKAGSSTVANILQRFGISHNLTFALPNTTWHAYGYNYISRAGDILTPKRFIPLANGLHHGYNILCNHAIYNRTAFRQVMAPDTAYISILREPFSQFVSAFEYFGSEKLLAKVDKSIRDFKNPISAYLQNPHRFEAKLHYFSYIKNKQAEDLGLGWNEYFVPSKLNKYLDSLDNDFSLIMIMEHFDESLLLLKRKFCWATKDILYIQQNKNKRKPKRNFTETDHTRHRQMAHLDYKLYDHFLQKFKEELQEQDNDFFQELAHFKGLLQKVVQQRAKWARFYVPANRWHEGFAVTQDDYVLMSMNELAGFDRLRRRAGLYDQEEAEKQLRAKEDAKKIDSEKKRKSKGRDLGKTEKVTVPSSFTAKKDEENKLGADNGKVKVTNLGKSTKVTALASNIG